MLATSMPGLVTSPSDGIDVVDVIEDPETQCPDGRFCGVAQSNTSARIGPINNNVTRTLSASGRGSMNLSVTVKSSALPCGLLSKASR